MPTPLEAWTTSLHPQTGQERLAILDDIIMIRARLDRIAWVAGSPIHPFAFTRSRRIYSSSPNDLGSFGFNSRQAR